MSSTHQPILLVEDDPHDAFFLQRALLKVRQDLPLQLVTDGEQALHYLNGDLKYSDRALFPLPFLIFLDLKLPYFSGFQILEQIKSNPKLTSIPVFVLTSSSEERDRQRALELGARDFFVKPPTPEMLLKILGPSSDTPSAEPPASL
jgi:CheY-like chemotaxis protein